MLLNHNFTFELRLIQITIVNNVVYNNILMCIASIEDDLFIKLMI
jgi:hypothetical protein